MLSDRLSLFPKTAEINAEGHLVIGGCDTVELVHTFGTPLYIFDEQTLRAKCDEFCHEFKQRYPNTLVIYACKAFISSALAALLQEEDMGLDVVSAGELHIAKSVGFPLQQVYFHGNNKSDEELALALDWGVGRVVVDNFHELHRLNGIAREKGTTPDILLRLSPGIDPHTHKYISTGVIDSKFGFPIVTGQAEEALVQAMAASNLNLVGLHCHLGSSIFEVEPYKEAVDIALRFAAQMRGSHGFELEEFSPGGGFAIPYVSSSSAPSIGEYAEAIISSLQEISSSLVLPSPRLVVEPGRAIVGQAGVALYTAGASKEVPGVRHYIFVDGGMADNIRPALYGAKYEAIIANKADAREVESVAVAGKFCESGDILIEDIRVPSVEAGDILAVPVSGAYSLPLASNYNASLKPAIVMAKRGQAHLIRRRETYEDLMNCELL